ncbi:MAG TPA: Asp-tRNA(Asn)/Glu-tRNA(Gln) amidotransferase subunit GatA [Candidatus Paceibacterota bacterium]|nr:Asp-tRNA(Asn)/Glu-tRNA(Gln) amidotransferase subunit GatA [Candidatus Paceibacterota bacterium]
MNTIEKLHALKSGKITAEQNVKKFLEAIEKDNQKGKKINAVLVINPNAIAEAKEVDKKIKSKNAGKLAGLGVIVKANICVKGLECNSASKTLEGWIAPYDATVIEKIKKEDAIILGISNMDEFACGGSGETSAFGPTKNPLQLDLIPGGSSSGSAASVAADFCDIALGSDTGGSIRNPASHCGIVGIKPSYGFVSRYGLMDYAMSLDQIGILSKDVESTALMLDIIKGHDEKDPTTYKSNLIKLTSENKIKIGIIKPLAKPEVQSLIDKKIEEAIKQFGWSKKQIEIDYIDVAVETYYPLVYVELFSSTRKYDGRRYGKKIEDVAGPELLRRILGGSEISKAEYGGRYYKKSLEIKEIIKQSFEKAFKDIDCIIVPTCPGLPWKIGESMAIEEVYAYDALTIPANLAEICALTMPAGEINRIPVGLQVMCAKGNEAKLLSISKMLEELK